jgi:mRNA interferase MazF
MNYIPERGDIVWLNFNPQAGHEQSGRRPALVISPFSYNKKVGLAIFCPVTNQQKGYPFEVELPKSVKAKGVVLADQVKNLDWQKRDVEFFCKVPEEILEEVFELIETLIS